MSSEQMTYGRCAPALLKNGYFACSALRPDVPHSYVRADDIAGVRCLDHVGRSILLSLVVTTRDKALRGKILAVLDPHGLAKGPARVDSAGAETRPLAYSEYGNQIFRKCSQTLDGELEAAVIADCCERPDPRTAAVSAVIRCDGTWRGGDLLSTPRSKLPEIDNAGIELLFKSLHTVFPVAEYVPVRQTDRPIAAADFHRPKFVPARSMRDFSGNPNALEAYRKAVAQSHAPPLPEFPPDEPEAAPPREVWRDGAWSPQSLVQRIFGGRS